MTISENSQLGLRFKSKDVKVKALTLLQKQLNNAQHRLDSYGKEGAVRYESANRIYKALLDAKNKLGLKPEEDFPEDYQLPADLENLIDEDSNKFEEYDKLVREPQSHDEIKTKTALKDFVSIERLFLENDDDKYFYICSTVYKAAELIKIGENFTGRILKDIKAGQYVYLLGKHEMVKFAVGERGIKGFYFDDKQDILFEWGVEISDGSYFYAPGFQKEFSGIMQLLTFIELGDIEVKWLHPLQKEKSPTGKKEDNTYNASLHTVYVVDSSWNQIIIRTTGFAVRGHFRLQPCGPGNLDRKLMWISAFEKHGYMRKPKATIIKND